MASAKDNANSHSNDSRPLRLTLRTLLAWLDDTLPPGEVRQIGNQVTESTFARDLVERIHRVTRRRRLTVPSSTGPDATDPNVVAAYLDNELPAEAVAEFEKRCLTSDVHLAEVASCHQILSMLGQKARVPAEARHRMSRLVKGREAIGRATPRALASEPDEATRTPVWGDETAPARPWWGRYAVPAGVVALIALMGLSAWRLAPLRRTPQAVDVAMMPPPAPAVRPAPEPEPAPVPEPEPEPAPAPEPAPEPAPAPAAPAGLAVLEPGETVALRFDPADRAWRRLAGGAALAAGDRVAGLAPFRTRLRLGELPVELVGPTEIILRPAVPGAGPALELVHGRLALRSVPESGATVQAGGTSLTLGATPAPVGLSLHAEAADAAEPGLRVYASEGELPMTVAGGASETLDGPAAITVGPGGRFGTGLAEPTPAWVTATEPPQADQLGGTAFAALFREGVPVSRALVEALEDDRPELQAMAVSALAATDSIELILPVLTRDGAPGLRRTAIDALRGYRRRGPDAQAALRAQLDQFNGVEWGATVDSLLAPPAGAASRETYEALIRLLTNADVGVRELAIERLMALSGRDALGYDPDRPDGNGARAWQGLLREGRLAPATAPPPAGAPAPGPAPAPAPGAVPAPPPPGAPGLVPPGAGLHPGRGPSGLPRIAGLRYDRGRLLLPHRGPSSGARPRRR
jgi:hypothetical protein